MVSLTPTGWKRENVMATRPYCLRDESRDPRSAYLHGTNRQTRNCRAAHREHRARVLRRQLADNFNRKREREVRSSFIDFESRQ